MKEQLPAQLEVELLLFDFSKENYSNLYFWHSFPFSVNGRRYKRN